MTKRMGTTRAQLDRLLNPANPANPATTLQTLVKGAGVVGERVKISPVNGCPDEVVRRRRSAYRAPRAFG